MYLWACSFNIFADWVEWQNNAFASATSISLIKFLPWVIQIVFHGEINWTAYLNDVVDPISPNFANA